ncbi:AzlD domain-containing protein [Ureibacillus sp. FSL K6-8385]|uniref:AzlD domain-containing protein n=1 Tax=Ureibacillus terrenus TaxID=118246 RepID=A0A540V3Q8_9BACL|nr:AzlD domain-containing protein [Ureibacillus terrenus]MED3661794.1 AzlD domain-containing protein [Ureibacillus terrenus]MED3763097.1 AzlD domain-containing protein [Ureibacillus terrenus]TQE91390.1 AzlD domain-containing protein [Ureibacillus terrenus]
MTTTLSMFLLILGCALVTWLPRVIPFILVRNIELPKVVLRWLQFIPVCILSSLVFQSLLDAEGKFVSLNLENTVAFVPTLLVAIWTKSLSKTVIVGVLTVALLRNFF